MFNNTLPNKEQKDGKIVAGGKLNLHSKAIPFTLY